MAGRNWAASGGASFGYRSVLGEAMTTELEVVAICADDRCGAELTVGSSMRTHGRRGKLKRFQRRHGKAPCQKMRIMA